MVFVAIRVVVSVGRLLVIGCAVTFGVGELTLDAVRGAVAIGVGRAARAKC